MKQHNPSKEQTFTYQTRAKIADSSSIILENCAQLFSKVERCLFADISSGKESSELKSDYLKKHGITARQFNAIRVQLEGKISSIKERQAGLILETKQKIASVDKRVQKLEKRALGTNKLHQKKRLLFNLNRKLQRLELARKKGVVSLCFGSKRLFLAQFSLKANGYQSHREWLADWQKTRADSFFLLGSKDESSGNQTCTATLADDGTITLRIRLPDSFAATYGKYLLIPGIYFDYGQENIIKALKSCEERKQLKALKEPLSSNYGLPISYRFKCDRKGWRVFASVPVSKVPLKTSSQHGVIGIDINSNHLAIIETDRFGNPITKSSMPLNTYGKNTNQSKALIGNLCAALVAKAKKGCKPIVIENLEFQKKKLELKEQTTPHLSRMLSSLTYNGIKSHLKSRAWREGVEVIEVNPAYTSIIGRIKFSRRYGLSIHQAAALVIGRRCLRVSERVPRCLVIPDGKEGYVTLPLPARNRGKHVWSHWRIINQKLKTVLAAHFRAIQYRSSSSKSAPVIKTIPKFVGEIPSCEFVNTTARLAYLDISTNVFV